MPFVSLSDDKIKTIRQLCTALHDDACTFTRNVLDVTFDRRELRTEQKFTSQEDARTSAAPLFRKNGFHLGLLMFGSIGAATRKAIAN